MGRESSAVQPFTFETESNNCGKGTTEIMDNIDDLSYTKISAFTSNSFLSVASMKPR